MMMRMIMMKKMKKMKMPTKMMTTTTTSCWRSRFELRRRGSRCRLKLHVQQAARSNSNARTAASPGSSLAHTTSCRHLLLPLLLASVQHLLRAIILQGSLSLHRALALSGAERFSWADG
jgi:hypothetical protein